MYCRQEEMRWVLKLDNGGPTRSLFSLARLCWKKTCYQCYHAFIDAMHMLVVSRMSRKLSFHAHGPSEEKRPSRFVERVQETLGQAIDDTGVRKTAGDTV